MINKSKIKHVHYLLNLLLYTPYSVENISDLKTFVIAYAKPNSDTECKEITLALIKYSLLIGAKKIYYLTDKGEYSLKNNNINIGVNVIEKDWEYLQTIRKIDSKDWLVEYWIEYTDEWKDELIKIRLWKK